MQEQERLPLSSDFDWDLERAEIAQEGFEQFDIRAAKRLIAKAPRKVEFREVVKYASFLLDGVKLRDDVDWDQIDDALPVIIGETAEGKFAIDGRHRLKKALRVGKTTFPMVALTRDETDLVRIAKA